MSDDLDLLVSAAKEAAAIAKRAFETGAKAWSKSDGSPVTEADLAVDHFLKERLLGARPGYGWLSEESPDDPARLTASHIFIVDPIDGTRAFVRRQDNWTISLAIAKGGVSVAGVIVAPLLGDTYVASRGGGARLNGTPLSASRQGTLDGAKIVAPLDAFRLSGGEPWPEIVRDNFASLAYRVALVASGARDGTVTVSEYAEWDIAAADLLLTEAGGRLSDLSGAPLRYNQPNPSHQGLVAAGAELFPKLLERVSGR
jgi:myo-inositol-1(or 4)-monophosphatase